MNTCWCLLTTLFLSSIALPGCGGGGSAGARPVVPTPVEASNQLFRQGQEIGSYQYYVPEEIGDGWSTAHLEDGGLDPQTINQWLQRVIDGDYGAMQGILIVKGNQLLLEEYFDGRYEGELIRFYLYTRHLINS